MDGSFGGKPQTGIGFGGVFSAHRAQPGLQARMQGDAADRARLGRSLRTAPASGEQETVWGGAGLGINSRMHAHVMLTFVRGLFLLAGTCPTLLHDQGLRSWNSSTRGFLAVLCDPYHSNKTLDEPQPVFGAE